MILHDLRARVTSYAHSEVAQEPTTFASLDDGPLERADLPHDWITSGNPVTHAKTVIASRSGNLKVWLWTCTVGGFRWSFKEDEVFLILEGEVRLDIGLPTERTLRANDIAFFTAGSVSEWEITKPVRKIAILVEPAQTLPKKIRRKALSLLAKQL